MLLLATFSAYASDRHGYFPIQFQNHSSIASDSQVYVVIKAMVDDHDCFMKLNTATGVGHCVMTGDGKTSADYTYKLSDLPNEVYLSKSYSGRIYLSVGYPMDLYVDPTDNDKILDADGFKPRDSNYYTLYDKVEYTYTNDGTWMNPTAVDSFSIPISVEQKGSISDVTKSGLSDSRADILKQIHDEFNQYDKTEDMIWNNLLLYYPTDDGIENDADFLRLVATGKAMASIPNTKPFDLNYLANENAYGFDYTDALWNYYKDHTLKVDCSELQSKLPDLGNYIFTGQVKNGEFVFSNGDSAHDVSLSKPADSKPFFAGAGGEFAAPENTPKVIIVRELTSAVMVGLVPAEDGVTLGKKEGQLFNTHKDQYFTDNELLQTTDTGPWYDLYSKALHSFGDDQPIYTFAYDDALGQDGTLHDPNANYPSTAVITLGDLSGTVIPDPYKDDTIYTIVPILGDKSTVTYKGVPLESNQEIFNVTIPFKVNLNGEDANIYIKPPMVRP